MLSLYSLPSLFCQPISLIILTITFKPLIHYFKPFLSLLLPGLPTRGSRRDRSFGAPVRRGRGSEQVRGVMSVQGAAVRQYSLWLLQGNRTHRIPDARAAVRQYSLWPLQGNRTHRIPDARAAVRPYSLGPLQGNRTHRIPDTLSLIRFDVGMK